MIIRIQEEDKCSFKGLLSHMVLVTYGFLYDMC